MLIRGIVNKGFRGMRRVVAPFNFSCNLIGKVFARQNLDPTSLGELIDLVGNIALGDAKARRADVLGHVFEYFLGEFALAEGK